MIGDALSESLNQRRAMQQSPPRKVMLPTFGGGGVLPGVDLTSNAALLEIMESDRDSERRKHFLLKVSPEILCRDQT